MHDRMLWTCQDRSRAKKTQAGFQCCDTDAEFLLLWETSVFALKALLEVTKRSPFTLWGIIFVYRLWMLFRSKNTFRAASSLSSVQFNHSVVSDSLRPHGLQHVRPSCPSPTPRVYPNSCPLSQWCHPIISSSALPFSSCTQSFPASGSFLMSQFFASGG